MVSPTGTDLGWSYDPRATLYVPYTSLGNATRIFLASPLRVPVPVVLVDVSADDYAYSRFMAKVWARGEAFINMEHDIVPWPGAIPWLLDCPQPWCFHTYQHGAGALAVTAGAAQMGLVRFRPEFIATLPGIWDSPLRWNQLDIHLFERARAQGWMPHQHEPPVFNANLKILAEHNQQCLPQPMRVKADELVFV